MTTRGGNYLKTLVLFVLAALLPLFTACETYDSFAAAFLGAKPPEDVVRIAVFEPLSGKDKAQGELERRGIELAHELRPKVLGMDVELLFLDNKSDIDEARRTARSLEGKNVSVVLGSYRSTLSLAGGDVFDELGIPAISITNTNPLVTLANDCYFRVCYAESFQGVAMAKYAVEELKATRAAVVAESENDYAQALSQAFSDKFAALTGNPEAIAADLEFPNDSRDFSKELAEIQATGVKAVFVPLEAETAVHMAKQADNMGLDVFFLGTELWERDDLTDMANEAVLSRMAFSSDFGQAQNADSFYKAYEEKYGDGQPDSAVALGFDAYMLAMDAIGRAGAHLDHGKIKGKLAETRSFPGVSGNISFDENGDTIKSVTILSVREGKLAEVYVAEPVWGTATGAGVEAQN